MPTPRRWVGDAVTSTAVDRTRCRRRVRRCRRSPAAACSCRCPRVRGARRPRRRDVEVTLRRAPGCRRTTHRRHDTVTSAPAMSTSAGQVAAAVDEHHDRDRGSRQDRRRAHTPSPGTASRFARAVVRSRSAGSRHRCASRKLVAPNSPSEMAAASPAPTASGRQRCGSDVSRQARIGDAPSVAAASDRLGIDRRAHAERAPDDERRGDQRMADRNDPPRRPPVERRGVERDQHAEPDRDRRRAEREHAGRRRACAPAATERTMPSAGQHAPTTDGEQRRPRCGRRRVAAAHRAGRCRAAGLAGSRADPSHRPRA